MSPYTFLEVSPVAFVHYNLRQFIFVLVYYMQRRPLVCNLVCTVAIAHYAHYVNEI